MVCNLRAGSFGALAVVLASTGCFPEVDVDPSPGEAARSQGDTLPFFPFFFKSPLETKTMNGACRAEGPSADPASCASCAFSAGAATASSGVLTAASFEDAGYIAWRDDLPALGSDGGLGAVLEEAEAEAMSVLNGRYHEHLEKSVCEAWALMASAREAFGEGEIYPTVEHALSGNDRARVTFDPVSTTYLVCNSDADVRKGVVDEIRASEQTWVRAFPPGYARHLMSKRTPGRFYYGTETYPDPQCLSEMRGRGARAYCAMRTAAEVADGGTFSTGSHTLSSFLAWDIGKAAGSLSLHPPTRFEGEHASAYVMPMITGSRLNSLTGPVVPEFGGFATPLVWVSADSENETDENPGRVGFGARWRNGRPVLYPQYGAREHARNLIHTDVLAGKGTRYAFALNDILLFKIWEVIKIQGDIQYTVDTGRLNASHDFDGGHAVNFFPGARSGALDATFPPNLATDAPFDTSRKPSQLIPFPDEGQPPCWGIELQELTSTAQGNRTRLEQLDDRSAAVTDTVANQLTIKAGVNEKFGPVKVVLNVNSDLSVVTRHHTVFREHLSMVEDEALNPAIPPTDPNHETLQTNALVTNEFETDVNVHPFEVRVEFSIRLNLFFGTFTHSWSKSIWEVDEHELGDKLTESAEHQKLRVGTYSSAGLDSYDHDNQQPSVFSHLPGAAPAGGTFRAFEESVGECLDRAVSIPEPTLPPPTTPGTEKDIPMCVVSKARHENPFACGESRASWMADRVVGGCTSEQCGAVRECITELHGWVCQGPGTLISVGAGLQRTRMIESKADADAFLTLLEQCMTENAARASNEAEAHEFADDVQDLYDLRLCEAPGIPLP